MAAFLNYLEQLFHAGVITLRARPTIEASERTPAVELLRERHRECSLALAGPPLPFDETITWQAAELLWWASWFLVDHNDQSEVVECQLALLERPRSAAQHLSGDVILSFLPAIQSRARIRAPDDVLTRGLTRLLRDWPLSGVLSNLREGPSHWDHLDEHDGLLLLYAERLAANLRPAWVPAEGRAREYVDLIIAERGLISPGRPGEGKV